MTALFLHGGGSQPATDAEMFGAFVAAAGGNRILLLIDVETRDDLAEYQAMLLRGGADEAQLLAVEIAPDMPLTVDDLNAHNPGAIFVCGGSTPRYHAALCSDPMLGETINGRNIPYGGTSAGAAIAAMTAILGGWQLSNSAHDEDGMTPIMLQDGGEGLAAVTVEAGLGLASFAVDVHAGQMGTLTRLIHVVQRGMAAEGWAIDENTMLVIEEGELRVLGEGFAYHVQPIPDIPGGVVVQPFNKAAG